MKIPSIRFSLLILALVLFLLPIVVLLPVIVGAKPPTEAVAFVIVNPSDGTVGTPVTVTIEAQKSNGQVDSAYQDDVTLVAGGSSTGAGLVDIVNGVGTKEINDLVAETVALSLVDSEQTFLNASSTQDVVFAAAAAAVLDQTDYWFRDDDGTEISATGYGASDTVKNTVISGVDPGAVVRLRFGVKASDADGTLVPRLEFKQGAGCTTGSWTAVASASDPLRLRLSDNFSDGDVTTGQITGGQFVAGKILESTNPASSVSLPRNESTEYEWSIEIAETAPTGTTYTFRVSQNGTALNAYGACPVLTTVFPPPTVAVTAEPGVITFGQSVALTWSSTNATSCAASGDWSGGKPISGTENVTPGSVGTESYALACSGSGGSASAAASVTVNVPPHRRAPPSASSADLSITKTGLPNPVIAGEPLTYTITVANNGPSDAEDVVVSDTLPLALVSPSLVSSQGGCTGFPCHLGDIASNLSAAITVASPVDAGTVGTVTNIASVVSATDDPETSNNASTQETSVSLPRSRPPAGKVEATPRPISVAFSGKAFPNAKLFVIDKDIRFETTVNQNIVADENGTFQVQFTGISQGLHSFGLRIQDKENRTTQTKLFNIDTPANGVVVKDILVPPTVGLPQRLVSRGRPAIVIGSASPNNRVILEIDEIPKYEANAEKDGSYKVAVDTGPLEFGTHRVRVKQFDISQHRESDYSPTNAFMVSRLMQPKTDLSGDGAVNMKDWSMFLSDWGSDDERRNALIDFNDDGKKDISDFSIFVRTIKK